MSAAYHFSNIPRELRERGQWVVWRRELREDGKPTKIPYQARRPSERAKSTVPATWAPYDVAVATFGNGAARAFDGIGFAVGDDPYVGVDLDHCRDPETGALEPWAAEIVERLAGYTEASPSGGGVRIFVRGLWGGRNRRARVEVYSSERYFTITGDVIGEPVETIPERAEALRWLEETHLADPERERLSEPRPVEPVSLDDQELLDRARRAKNGAKFEALYDRGDWEGQGFDSPSEADLSLCSMLAFWTGRHPLRIDSLFRSSALMREKWERHDYRTGRLELAVAGCRDVYTPRERPLVGRNGSPAGEETTTPPRSLDEVIAIFKRWFHLPDPGALLAVLGAVVANRMDGDPVWLLLVAPPGWGKTEVVAPLAALPDVHPTATLTEAALLSGTPRREAKGAKGGLLREIGASGIILCKDFGSVLSMNRDTRAQALGALREVFDGSWTRHVGTDGGKTLHWSGKVGLIAGCTAVIDNHYSVMGAMGDRMALYRLPEIDPRAQLRTSMRTVGREASMRRELREAVAGLLQEAQEREIAPLTEAEEDRLIALACLVVKARSGVVRDGYSREIELVLGAEAPARLGKMLLQLLRGILAIGASREEAWAVITKAGMDCIPAIRRTMLELLAVLDEPVTTAALAEDAGYPTGTVRRALEELVVYGLAVRIKVGDGKADVWELGDETRLMMREATFPEMYEGVLRDTPFTNNHSVSGDISGKVLEGGSGGAS